MNSFNAPMAKCLLQTYAFLITYYGPNTRVEFDVRGTETENKERLGRVKITLNGGPYMDYSESQFRNWIDRECQISSDLKEDWQLAYTAFQGAFDTLVDRRKDDSPYSEDVRTRMREFNRKFLNEDYT